MDSLIAFFTSTTGKVVAGVVGAVVLVGALIVAGMIEAAHPAVHVANVFSKPLQIRAGNQTVALPAHGAAHFTLDDRSAPIVVYLGDREIDRFAPPYRKDDVLNVLGAAPIERRQVVWTISKTDATMMDGKAKPANGNYCGQRVVPSNMAADILSSGPEKIPLPQGAASVTRESLEFDPEDSPHQCASQLDKGNRPQDAAKIRAIAAETGDQPPAP